MRCNIHKEVVTNLGKVEKLGKRITFPVIKRANGITDSSIDFLLHKEVDMIENRYFIKWGREEWKTEHERRRWWERRAGKKVE